MEQDIGTFEFYIPVNHVYPFNKAVKEIGVDVIIDSLSEEHLGYQWRKVTFIGSLTTLFSLGYLTGINVYQTIAVNPLQEAMDIIQNKILKFKKNDESNTI